jgi:small-conductance mechanosensitive channel
MTEWLRASFLSNTLQQWALAIALGTGTVLGLRIALRVATRRLSALAQRTATGVDDLVVHMVGRTQGWFLAIVAAFVGARALEPGRLTVVVERITALALVVQGGWWAIAAVTAWLEAYRRRQLATDAAAATTIGALGFVARLVVWSLVVVLSLDNLGVDITALITGLGIGGIAVALAVQNILGDLFASLTIVLDRPFVIGDFLAVGDFVGKVDRIGLKTTRIRSLSGEEVVFSNGDLLGSRIRNYGRLFERRVLFVIGVTYQTPRALLERIPQMLRAAVEAQGERVRFDRSHFKGYGDFSINFETVYFVLSPDYNRYMDLHQAVCLHIHERFEGEGVEFAYPTQTLFLAKQPE